MFGFVKKLVDIAVEEMVEEVIGKPVMLAHKLLDAATAVEEDDE